MSLYSNILIDGICGEIKKVHQANCMSATIIMLYVAIDTFAYLSMPAEKHKNDSKDFIKWVNKYVKTDRTQPYTYKGKDLWAARCAKLHTYSSYSNYAKRNNCKLFGYTDGSNHIYKPDINNLLVLISIPRFVQDFILAVEIFLNEALGNEALKNKIDGRLEKICAKYDIEY